MLRFVAITLAAIAFTTSAHAIELPNLSAHLTHYIAEFDLAELDHTTLLTIERVIENPDMSHGMKVLTLHDILESEGALLHADMHGAKNLLTADLR